MPRLPTDYSKGFIYKLCCLDVNVTDIYIGSSTNFKERKKHHKSDCNNEKSKKYNTYVYEFIRDNGGWSNWTMIELYKYPSNDKRELECEENRMMNELQSQLNSQKSYRTEEEHKITNKKYREKHKEILNMKARETIVCDNCNRLANRSSIARHKKYKICLNFNKET
jgi:hypothetical protein